MEEIGPFRPFLHHRRRTCCQLFRAAGFVVAADPRPVQRSGGFLHRPYFPIALPGLADFVKKASTDPVGTPDQFFGKRGGDDALTQWWRLSRRPYCIPRYQHSARNAQDSNHGFRLVWVGAVAGSVGLMIGPFFGYGVRLDRIAHYRVVRAAIRPDRRAVCERTNAGARTHGVARRLKT